MNLLCKAFGHKLPKGYAGGLPYLTASNNWVDVDGMGILHVTLQTRCDRCGTLYSVAKLHYPKAYTVI